MFKVVEKFKSIQSEGYHSGTPATFIRLYGCNLACDFGNGFVCDEGLHTDSSAIVSTTMLEIVDYCKGINHVVITGGEPSLNNINPLIDLLKEEGHYVQVETNGHKLENINSAQWITYSPKHAWNKGELKLLKGFNELKLLGSPDMLPDDVWGPITLKYLQPIGYDDDWNLTNCRWAAQWVVDNPSWKLSLQTHKIYGGQ